jgi:hypothetical protein
MSGAALAEIREAEAPPAIAAIYAALNEGIGIGQVNLIWRHAAALPGVLDWLWAQAAPALASGAAAAARDGNLPTSLPSLVSLNACRVTCFFPAGLDVRGAENSSIRFFSCSIRRPKIFSA